MNKLKNFFKKIWNFIKSEDNKDKDSIENLVKISETEKMDYTILNPTIIEVKEEEIVQPEIKLIEPEVIIKKTIKKGPKKIAVKKAPIKKIKKK